MHFKIIDSPELLQEAFRLRFKVYCRERHFLSALDYPQGHEQDVFDVDAAHFIAFDQKRRVLGTVRLVLPTCSRFPIELKCPDLVFGKHLPARRECAEISRLSVSKEFRLDLLATSSGRRISPVALGLCHLMYQECRRQGIRYCLALMEKSLRFLLQQHGFQFHQVGPEVDFLGPVAPYLIDTDTIDTHALFVDLVSYPSHD